ncbi:MAG: 50S ribosomal protein L5 [Anaerolineales bacterium]|nr:50S ribosomal protein L5 [Anaerolineales bacterium]MCK5633718.1 50S ribosomal protein L5 [Anaerolineales bacterium]
MAHHLKERFQKEILPTLMKEFNLKNPMMVPKIEKIVVNVGVGEAIDNAKALDAAVGDMTIITGQQPVVTKARKSIANFKLREGASVGVKVTLRGERMWSFFDRLVNVAMPRTRDFRGVSPNSFDGRGNYTLGIREQLIFPEIGYDKIDKIRGFEVTFVTSAPNDELGHRLLQLLGMPFGKGEIYG